jgi:hypothetical protein
VAARDFSAWQPIFWDDQIVGRAFQPSAIMEHAGRTIQMKSIQYDVPRYADSAVGGGSQLTEGTSNGDVKPIYDYQFNGKETLDEAQLEDSPADTLTAVSYEWLNSLHIAYDNASIGVTGARSTTVSDYRPYNSIYYTLTQADSTVGYSANANLLKGTLSTSGYTNLNNALGLVENTKFYDMQNAVAILHPSLRQRLRGILDGNQRPIFVESSNGTAGGGVRPQYELFGTPVAWSFGAVTTSGGYTGNVGGTSAAWHPLVVFANRRHLVRGVRIEPQAQFINANINLNALEHTVQHRARLGFTLTVPQSASILEVTD